MANYFSATGIVDTNSNPQLLDKSFDIIWSRRDEHRGVLGQFFDKKACDSLSFKITSTGSAAPLPSSNEDTQPLPYYVTAPGYAKTFTMVSYRQGVRVTETALKADRFGQIPSTLTGNVKAAMRLDEYLYAAVLDGAFAGTDGADSLSLCNDSHPHENVDRGTWDNLGTGALTGANLFALMLLGENMTNEQGDPDPVMAKTLVIRPELQQKAMELIKSPLRAEDALNATTQVIDTLNIVVSPFLSSTTAYYLIGDRTGYDRGLHEFEFIPWNVKDNTPANADIVMDKRIKGVKAVGFTTSKNVFGSAGA